MSTLDHYWPSQARIDQCIRTEAETVNDAVLLAVHEPGPLKVRAANGSAENMATERELLNELMRPADDGSAVLVAITGDSGVGKSHMVRWLHAQLQRHPARERLVIVLVPKTASLRQVVELILEPLEGEAYTQLKTELSRVVETLQPDEASRILATQLAIELDRMHQQDIATLRGGRQDDRALRTRAEHAKGLSHLLRDPVVFDTWFEQVLKRIVKHTLHGGNEAETGESRRFSPDDLRIQTTWDPTLATRAANLYLQKLQSDEGAALTLAAELLQAALDPALRTVFRFSEVLGQRTIEEIVDDIRRHLLAQDRELVLLIEDFAALTGIHEPLLSLIIAESDHQGRRIRAPLRTALAVTDGFLPGRQTILTRAKREWIIPNSAQNDEEIIERLVDLSGRYLNAARWGLEALSGHFAQFGGDDLYGWVRTFEHDLEAEDSDRLKAFGASRHGHPLFPLSRESIGALARRELRQGTGLIFNPRAFINHVLREVLMYRAEFLRGEFPPVGFKDAMMNTGVEMAIRTQPLTEAMRARLAPALVYWAGNPSDLASPPRVSREVFGAFRLAWPFDAKARTTLPSPPNAHPVGTAPTARDLRPAPPEVEPAPPASPPTTPQDEAHAAWAAGELLGQQPANQIRQILAQALNDRMDWNALRMRRQPIMPAHFWLPYARVGNPSAAQRFEVGVETRPLAFEVRAGVLALCRWFANGRDWNYPGAEDDYAAAQLLLDDLEAQAVRWFSQAMRQRAQASLRTLHRQALLLRMTRKAEPDEPALVDYFQSPQEVLFAPGNEDRSPETPILELSAEAVVALEEVRDALLESVACFQGTGSQVMAVDRVRLQSAWNAKDDDSPDSALPATADKARQIARSLSSNRLKAVVTRYTSVLDKRLPTIHRLVGPDPEVSLVAPIKNLRNEARRAGTLSEVEHNAAAVDRALEVLASDSGRSVLRYATSFSAPDTARSAEFQLAVCAEIDLISLRKTVEALETLELLVTKIQRAADSQLKASGGADVADALRALRAELTAVADEGATP